MPPAGDPPVNRFLAAGFTAKEIALIRARCLSYGGTDPIWDELEEAWRVSHFLPPKETS